MKSKFNLFVKLSNFKNKYLSDAQFLSILSVIIGATVGMAAVVIKNAVHFIQLAIKNNRIQQLYPELHSIFPIVGIFIAILFARYIIRGRVGHGIPSVLYAIAEDKGRIKRHNLFSSIITSTFTVGFGGSVGLEGPTVATGAAYGSYFGNIFHMTFKQRIILLGAASAGAMAAIFKAPITAIFFALEVIMIDLTITSIIPLLLASISAILMSYFFLGQGVIYHFELKTLYQISDLPLYAILAILSGLVSVYFTKIYVLSEKLFDKIKDWKIRLLAGGIILGILIYFFPALYGEGYEAINSALSGNHDFALQFKYFTDIESIPLIILILSLTLGLKVIATSVTFGAGGIGGIFAPTLFIGASSGLVYSLIAQQLGYEIAVENFVLVAMAGAIAGNLQAPLTAIFLIAEITGGYRLIVPLMIVATISYLISRIFIKNSVYTIQLARRGQLMTHHADKNILRLLNVGELVETNFTTVRAEDKLRDLVAVIANSKRNDFPVIDSENNLVGIVSMSDIRKIIFRQELYDTKKVSDYMFIPTVVVNFDEHMEDIVKKYQSSNLYNLPVVNNGKYVGFVSRANIFSAYRKLLQEFSAH